MNKKVLLGLFLIIMSTILLGCNKEENLGDTYNKGIDSQYMYVNEIFPSNIVSSEDGYYLSSGMYIYYVDKSSMKQTILCNKPNCLHDEEIDESKKYNCNAFFKSQGMGMEAMNYYKDNLYGISIYDPLSKSDKANLLEISKDGSKRKVVYEFEGDISQATLHRGYLYFVSNSMKEDENNGKLTSSNSKLIRIDVTKRNPKEEVLYETNLKEDGIGSLIAYGNNIYFTSHGYEDEELKNYKSKFINYNISNKESKEILSQYKDGEVGKVSIQNGKLVFLYWHYNDDDERNKQMYTCDLNGDNIEPLFKTDFYGIEDSDDKFTYVDNIAEKINGKDIERIIDFYDTSGKKVDTLNLGTDEPISNAWSILPGDENYLFLIYKDDKYFNIKRIDKNDIGSKNIKVNDFFKVNIENTDTEIKY
ncbi:hypothetical protein [Clostridium sp.]|uniref:hypothetical protein n=1 Tax=Clostridium sp. TaxID=1506 RepID=UPI002FCB333A